MPKKNNTTNLAETPETATPLDPTRKGPVLKISPPNIQRLAILIEGAESLVINRFGEKAQQSMQAAQELGSVAKTRKKRDPKDFAALFNSARHVSPEGWDGLAAAAFRNAMISACRVADFVMAKAKLAVFIVADGEDQDGMPIVRIHPAGGGSEPPECWIAPVRNASGVFDLRARPRYRSGWRANLRIEYDGGVFEAQDIVNLVHRVGFQVGVGEGRPDSKNSCGLGLGLFRLVTSAEQQEAA